MSPSSFGALGFGSENVLQFQMSCSKVQILADHFSIFLFFWVCWQWRGAGTLSLISHRGFCWSQIWITKLFQGTLFAASVVLSGIRALQTRTHVYFLGHTHTSQHNSRDPVAWIKPLVAREELVFTSHRRGTQVMLAGVVRRYPCTGTAKRLQPRW